MDRIKVPSQSKQSLEKVFDNLQDTIKTNIDRRLSSFYKTFGIKKFSNDDDFKLKLTTDTHFSIDPGKALTDSLEIINLSSITTYNLSDIITVSPNSYYLIKLQWDNSVGSSPVDVANGFNYSGNPAKRYSKYNDRFTVVAESVINLTVSKTDDQIYIGVIHTNASSILDTGWTLSGQASVNGVIDLRNNNLLEFSDIRLNDASKLKTAFITAANAGLIVQPENTNTFVRFNNSSGDVILYINNLEKNIGINKITGASSAELDVNGTINATAIKVGGVNVMLDDVDPVNDIINFKIIDISSTPGTTYDTTAIASGIPSTNPSSENRKLLNVKFKWGYDDITGTGSTGGHFTINNSGLAFANNSLIGYWLYIDNNHNYKITGNTNLTLTLQDGMGAVPDLTGITVIASNPAKIHHNVNSYQLTVIPVVGTEKFYEKAIEREIKIASSPVIMTASLFLEAGVKHYCSIRGVRGLKYGNNTVLPSGSYNKYGISNSYGDGNGYFIPIHASLNAGTSSVQAETTDVGFKIKLAIDTTVAGSWSEAEEFEVAWKNTVNTVDFSHPEDFESTIISNKSRSLNVVTIMSRDYTVAVRPLIGGLAVGQQLNLVDESGGSIRVTSGSGGVPPNSSSILTLPIKLTTFSGTLDYNASTNVITIANTVVSPAGSTEVASSVEWSDVQSAIITINTKGDFRIIRSGAPFNFKIAQLNGGNALPTSNLTGETFEINTSKKGRLLGTTTIPNDVVLTRLEFDCDFLDKPDTKSTLLRVYQKTRENSFDSLVIETSDSGFSSTADAYISSTYGERTLLVDLWSDTSTYTNKATVWGTLIVYGKSFMYKNIEN